MSDSFSNYPRGTPYKAPPEGSPSGGPDLAMRGWAVRMALVTLLGVAVIVSVGAFIIIRAVRAPVPVPPAVAGENTPAPSGPAPRETKPTATVSESKPKPSERETANPPKDKPPVEKKDPPARDDLLDAVGGLLGAHLHQGYLNIGLLADAQENDIYSPEDAKKVLSTITGLLDNVDGQIAKLTEANLGDADRKQLELARKVGTQLRTQAKELRAYWDTPDKDKEVKKDHETKYFKAREEAWSGIKELLEIKE
jgi:hypothetical protein